MQIADSGQWTVSSIDISLLYFGRVVCTSRQLVDCGHGSVRRFTAYFTLYKEVGFTLTTLVRSVISPGFK